MEATVVEFKDGIKARAHRKEKSFMEQYSGIVIIDGELQEAVTLRLYGTNARNYACLWYNDKNAWGSGSGVAGGYGYHRPSAAAAEAFQSAGVQLTNDISGRGDRAIEEAVVALTKALYPFYRVHVVKAHG
jgi:hypothetical protein